MANLIPQIAEMLGVEIGEEFKIKGYELTYMITDDKGLMATNDSPETGWKPANAANALFVALLNGTDEIVKLPWKPGNNIILLAADISETRQFGLSLMLYGME